MLLLIYTQTLVFISNHICLHLHEVFIGLHLYAVAVAHLQRCFFFSQL